MLNASVTLSRFVKGRYGGSLWCDGAVASDDDLRRLGPRLRDRGERLRCVALRTRPLERISAKVDILLPSTLPWSVSSDVARVGRSPYDVSRRRGGDSVRRYAFSTMFGPSPGTWHYPPFRASLRSCVHWVRWGCPVRLVLGKQARLAFPESALRHVPTSVYQSKPYLLSQNQSCGTSPPRGINRRQACFPGIHHVARGGT